jgi:23S rRNA (adenine2030-N6)-methyltransferase
MASPHFGNLGDVWKHVVLCEALASERPLHYWETHAGSASYPLSHSPARDYGAYHLLEGGWRSSRLAQSAYFQELMHFSESEEAPLSYPGSAFLAMRLLRDGTDYVFCDVDGQSVGSLHEAARALGLSQQVHSATRDGVAAIQEMSHDYKGDPADVLVHVDPFDPHDETAPGLSAVSLASELIARGFKLMFWYGYDFPEQRTWPWTAVTAPGESRWCGDLIVRSNLDGGSLAPMSDISPLIGCGVLAANLQVSTTAALRSLGDELVSLYETSVNPHTGTSGALEFREITAARVG